MAALVVLFGVGIVARPRAADMVGTWVDREGSETITLRPDGTWHDGLLMDLLADEL